MKFAKQLAIPTFKCACPAAAVLLARKIATTLLSHVSSDAHAMLFAQMAAMDAMLQFVAGMGEIPVALEKLSILLIRSLPTERYFSRLMSGERLLKICRSSFQVSHYSAKFLRNFLESGSNSYTVLNTAGFAVYKNEVYSFGGYSSYGVEKTRILKLVGCEFQVQAAKLTRDFSTSYGSIA